jgi:hypothetical protein
MHKRVFRQKTLYLQNKIRWSSTISILKVGHLMVKDSLQKIIATQVYKDV